MKKKKKKMMMMRVIKKLSKNGKSKDRIDQSKVQSRDKKVR